jgi:hypothetical protein
MENILSINLWSEYNKAKRFSTLRKDEQDSLIKVLQTKEAAQSYYFGALINVIKPHIDHKIFLSMAYNFIENGRAGAMKSRNTHEIFEAAYRIDPSGIKSLAFNSSSSALTKLILICDNLTIDEEVKGLRALSTSKYMPNKIHELKYKPKLEALKKLPPVMRLKTIETLANSGRLKYNIFEHVPEDEFKALLFTSSLKHTDRVQVACNKYDELKYMGIESTVRVSGCCSLCGDYSISITSKVVRTSTGMKETSLGRYLINRSNCPFCYTTLKQKPTFEEIK